MMNKFPRSTEILSQIQGLQGAIIFNFDTREILSVVGRQLDLSSVIDGLASAVKRHQTLIRDLELFDIIEQTLITTERYYHITCIVPQFDNVAIYLVVTRYTMLPYITQVLEDVIYSMH